jgi:hypothetical protein
LDWSAIGTLAGMAGGAGCGGLEGKFSVFPHIN